MSIFVPLVAERAALGFGNGYRIHASVDSPLAVSEHCRTHFGARTVCGSDLPPYVVGLTNRPGSSLMMTWPPPPQDRCTDCEAVLGRPRRPRHGWGTWERLIDSEGAAVG